MAATRYFPEPGMDRTDAQACNQQEVLRRAVAKVVELGRRRGVDTEQMIQMLESGLTVTGLLEYLLSQNNYPA
jgi:hypothetical protein